MSIKLTPVEIAEKITELSRWIEGAEKELGTYLEYDSKLKLDLKQCTNNNFSCHYIRPNRLSESAQSRLDKYLKRVIKEEIAARTEERDALIKRMARKPRTRKPATA